MNIRRTSLQLLLLTGVSANAAAHHSASVTFDLNETKEIQGAVVDYQLKSPHSALIVDVTEDDGAVERWEVEISSLPSMRRAGFTESTFEPGDAVTVYGWPHRDPETPMLFGRRFITADGTDMGRMIPERERVQPPRTTANAAGVERIAGRWMPTAPRPDGGDVSPLPLNQAGLDARAGYDQRLSPANDCTPLSVPSIFYPPYLNDIRFDDQGVIFTHEVYGITRTVPLSDEPAQVEATGFFGVGRARVEGDALVIESSDYPPSKWGLAIAALYNGNGADVPSSAEKRVTERYSVGDDRALKLEYTVHDPVYLHEPYTNEVRFARAADDQTIYPYDCEADSASFFSR